MVSTATLRPTKPDVYTLVLPEQVAYPWPRNEGEVSRRNQESQSEGKEKRKKLSGALEENTYMKLNSVNRGRVALFTLIKAMDQNDQKLSRFFKGSPQIWTA